MRDESRDLLLDSEDLANAVVGKEDLVFVREASRKWGIGAGNPNSTGVRYVPFEQYQKIVDLVGALKDALSDMSCDLDSDEQDAYNKLSELLK